MRFLLLALFISTQAFAQATDRNLVDLMYLPTAGTLYGETAFNWDSTQYNVDKTTEVDNHDIFATQTVGFGFTDMISVAVSLGYQSQGEQSTKAGNTERTYVDTEGTLNPTLSGTWRVMDQGSSAYNLDLTASYSPDLIDSEGSSNDEEFTAGSGRATYGVAARLGKKEGTVHWAFNASVKLNGEATTELSNANDEKVTDSHHVITVGYSRQGNMLPWLDFRAYANLSRTSGYDIDDAGTKSEVDPRWVVDFGGRLLASPFNNTLVTYLGLGTLYSTGYDVKTGGTTSEIKDFKGWTATLGALYQF